MIKGAICSLLFCMTLFTEAQQSVTNLATGNEIQWNSIGPSGGGYYEALTFSPTNSNTIFLGTDVGGFFVSHDRGNTWTAKNDGLTEYFIERIAVHPNNDHIILLAAAGGIFRTTDQGESWTPIRETDFPAPAKYNYSAPINVITFDPQNPQMVYAGQGRTRGDKNNGGTRSGYIYKSTDTGQTWTLVSDGQINTNAIIYDIQVCPNNSSLILAATDYGVYASTNAGTTWTSSNTGMSANQTIAKLAFSPSQPNVVYATVTTTARDSQTWNGNIYRSTDYGQTWTSNVGNFPKTVGASGAAHEMTTSPKDLFVDPSDEDTVYVANFSWIDRGIYKTTDAGTTWENLITSSNVACGWTDEIIGAPFCMAPNPQDLSTSDIIFGDSMQIFLTENGGSSWTQKYCTYDETTGEFSGNGANVLAVTDIVFDPINPDRLYVCNLDAGLLISDDRGVSFRHADINGPASINGHVYTLAVDANGTNRTLWLAAEAGAKLRCSTDDAITWAGNTNGLPGGSIKRILIDRNSNPQARRLIVLVEGYGVYELPESSNSWQSMNDGLPAPAAATPKDLILNPLDSNHLILAAGGNPTNSAGIYEYDGQSWTKINTANLFSDIQKLQADPSDFNILYLGQRDAYINGTSYPGGVYMSTDGGQNWELKLKGRLCADLAVHPEKSDQIYAVFSALQYHDNSTGLGVVRSLDRGETWTRQNTNLESLKTRAIKINPQHPDEIYVGTGGMSSFVCTDKCDSPYVHWKFDETSGSSLAGDSSIFGHPGDISGSAERVDGLAGQALKLQGSDAVTLTQDHRFNNRTGFTISTWLNMQQIGNSVNSLIMSKTGAFRVLLGWAGDMRCQVTLGGTIYSTSSHSLPQNEWVHLAAKYDATDKQVTLYIDGQIAETYTLPGGLQSYLLDDNTNPIVTKNTGGSANRITLYDDLRLYNYALDDQEIYNLADPGLILRLKLDDATGASDIADSSMYDSTGDAADILQSVLGVHNKALSFFNNQQIAFDSSDVMMSSTDLSICGWIYLLDSGNQNNSYLFMKNQSVFFGLGWNEYLKYQLYIGGSPYTLNSSRIPVGEWTHLAATFSATTKEMRLYINGELDSSLDLSGVTNCQLDLNANDVRIGSNGTDNRLSCFDDVLVFGHCLTSNDVWTLYETY